MTLPVLRSLPDPRALQQALDLPVLPRLIRAHVNDTYACGDRVLRLYAPGRDMQAIAGELDALHQLKQAGVPVAGAKQLEPTALTLPEGVRYAALFERASGVGVHEARSEDAIAALGRSLALLHTVAVRAPRRSTLPSVEALSGTVRAALPDVRIEPFDVPETDDTGFIHGDADSSNALLDAGVATLIDFDDCAVGPRMYDVACVLTELERWGWPRPRAMCDAFIAAYRDVRPIERANVRRFQALRSLWVLARYAMHAEVWGDFRLSPRFVERLVRDIEHYRD